MKLIRVQIQNYRSIVDSGVVNIEDVVTVVIGQNEQGKTNFLKALASFNEDCRYVPGDLPNHLRPALEEQNQSEIPIATVWMIPESSDTESLSQNIKDLDSTKEFRAVRYFDHHYEYFSVKSDGTESPLEFSAPEIGGFVSEIETEAESLRAKLKEHGSRSEEFANSIEQVDNHINEFIGANFADAAQIDNLSKTFATALKGLPAQDKPIQEDISASIKRLQGIQAEIKSKLESDTLTVFKNQIPSFVFHSARLDYIPNEVDAASFINDPEGTSSGMAKLCRAAGLSIQKLKQLTSSADTAQRQVYEDHHSGTISGGINEFWTQTQYDVRFRIDTTKLGVFIKDDKYTPGIPPEDRSDGFQWYLSFYCTLLSESDSTRQTIILLDNPGLELHPDGQRDIKRFLEEKQPPNVQVIYVTHSPAMIDPFYLEQVRMVERCEDEGTTVSNWKFKEEDHADLLEPVRSAIGASLVTSLMFSKFNVLVEGAADKPILEGAFASLHGDEADKILVNGSVSETKDGFLPRFYERANLPVVVFLDADSGGRKLAQSLKKWEIPDSKVVSLVDIFPEKKGSDFELEDVLSKDFYHQAVLETYPDKPVEAPDGEEGKRTKQYEAAYGEIHQIGFSKRRVAETVKKLLKQKRVDDGTKENLKKITTSLMDACQGQCAPARGAQSA